MGDYSHIAGAAGQARPPREPELFGLVGSRAAAMFPKCEARGIHICRFVLKPNGLYLPTTTVSFEAHVSYGVRLNA